MALIPRGLRLDRLDWRLLGLVVLTVFYLLPGLKTGYYSEDCWHSAAIVGRLMIGECDSIFGVMSADTWATMQMGRFFPLTNVLIDLVFYLIRDVFAYKTYLLALTVLDIVIFYELVRRLTGNRNFACLAGCLTVALFQFRVFIDPLLAYYGQMQLVIACLLCSLIALDRYLAGRGRGWLVASAGAYLLCTLAYEVTYALFPLHLALIFRSRRGWSGRLGPALPFLGAVGLCGMTTFVIQRLFPSDLYVHKMSFAPLPFLKAMATQATAALPLSYFLGDRHQVFTRVQGLRGFCRWVVTPGSIAMALGTLVLCHACLRRRTASGNLPAGAGSLMSILATMLIVLPVPLIATSPEHRQHFWFGVGWIVFLIECFGVGLLLATAIWCVLGRSCDGRRITCKSAVISLLIAVLMGVSYRANVEVAASFSAPAGSPFYNGIAAMHGASNHQQRLNLEAALEAGLLDEVPVASTLELANVYPHWHDARFAMYFYAKHTGKSYHLTSDPPNVRSHASTYRIRDVALDEQSGFVIVSPVGTFKDSFDTGIRIFVRRRKLRSNPSSVGFVLENDDATTQFLHAGTKLAVIREGRDWGLFSLIGANAPKSADHVRVAFDTRRNPHPEE